MNTSELSETSDPAIRLQSQQALRAFSLAIDNFSNAAKELVDVVEQQKQVLDKTWVALASVGASINQDISVVAAYTDVQDAVIGLRDHTIWKLHELTLIAEVIGQDAYIQWILTAFQISEAELQEIITREERKRQTRRLEELATMPYHDYLLSSEWRELRLRILERDGYRCQVCNSSERLNVHHRDYTRRGYEDDSDLTTLCQGCHQIFHENGRLAEVYE